MIQNEQELTKLWNSADSLFVYDVCLYKISICPSIQHTIFTLSVRTNRLDHVSGAESGQNAILETSAYSKIDLFKFEDTYAAELSCPVL